MKKWTIILPMLIAVAFLSGCTKPISNVNTSSYEENNTILIHNNEIWKCDAQICKIGSISSDIECSNNAIIWGVDIYKGDNFIRKCEGAIIYGWGCNWYFEGKINNSLPERTFAKGDEIKVHYWCMNTTNTSSAYEPQNSPSVEVKYINYTVNLISEGK